MREALYLVRMQEELFDISELPIFGFEDNKATYQKCTAHVSASRLKHVETMCFKVEEYVREGILRLTLVGTDEQLADLLTKPLQQTKFIPLKNQLMYSPD